MATYKQNPDLPLKVCITITGEKEYCKNCTRKNKQWLVRGVEYLQINDTWYRADNPSVRFDYELKTLFVKKPFGDGTKVFDGVVGFKGKKPILGDFTKNKFNNCIIEINDKNYTCISEDVLQGTEYTEELSTGVWKILGKNNKIVQTIDHSNKGYNIEDQGYKKLIDTYNAKPYKFNIDHAKIANLLKGTTFGIELEACAGNLPQHLLNRTGCCICKDGSTKEGRLYPPEYVTVPLSGAKGIGNAIELCGYLSTRNIIDLKCSYHLHLGGFTTSRQFLVALHSLAYKIQGDVFKMFPGYKLKPEGIKTKNYCKVLPKIFKQYKTGMDFTEYINHNYKELFKYLSEDQGNRKVAPGISNNRKNKVHNGGTTKWNRLARYHWLNMINSVFSERNTVEFRLHTPTFNATKIINWLLICNAICRYAERHTLQCIDGTKVTFSDVLDYYQQQSTTSQYNAFITNYLKAYVDQRTKMFKKDKRNGDMLSDHELKSDKNFTFTHDDKTLF